LIYLPGVTQLKNAEALTTTKRRQSLVSSCENTDELKWCAKHRAWLKRVIQKLFPFLQIEKETFWLMGGFTTLQAFSSAKIFLSTKDDDNHSDNNNNTCYSLLTCHYMTDTIHKASSIMQSQLTKEEGKY
jgi:hypothetical protein